MGSSRRVPNPLALAALAWLVRQPMHPYEIGRRLEDSGEDRHIKYNQSSLYMVMDQLLKAGFVREQGTMRNGQRPRRTVYAVTDEGRHEFFHWIRVLIAQPRNEYPHFATALSLMRLLAPGDVVELLECRLSALSAKTDEIRGVRREAVDRGSTWPALIQEQYALAMVRAEADFVTRLMHSLTTSTTTKAESESTTSESTTWSESTTSESMGRKK